MSIKKFENIINEDAEEKMIPEEEGKKCTSPGRENRMKAFVFHILKLFLAGFLIYWVMKDIKMEELAAISGIRLLSCCFTAFFLVFCQSTLSAVRWQMLVKAQGIELSFSRAFSLTFQGIFFSLCLPGGAVGGDVVKAAYIVRETQGNKKVEAITSIFVDRLTGLIALFGLALVFVLFHLKVIVTFPKALQAALYTLSLLCLAGLCAAFFILFHDLFLKLSLIKKLVLFVDKFVKGAVTRILSSVDIYRKKWKTLFLTCIMGIFIIHPLLFLALYFIADILTGKMQNIFTVFFASAMGNVASCLPGTVGGLGARDKIMQLLLERGEFSSSDAAMIPILYTLGYISCSLTGALCFILDSFLGKRKGR